MTAELTRRPCGFGRPLDGPSSPCHSALRNWRGGAHRSRATARASRSRRRCREEARIRRCMTAFSPPCSASSERPCVLELSASGRLATLHGQPNYMWSLTRVSGVWILRLVWIQSCHSACIGKYMWTNRAISEIACGGSSFAALGFPLFALIALAYSPSLLLGQEGSSEAPAESFNVAPQPPMPLESKHIFGIIPNNRTSPSLRHYKPLSPRKKFEIARQD